MGISEKKCFRTKIKLNRKIPGMNSICKYFRVKEGSSS